MTPCPSCGAKMDRVFGEAGQFLHCPKCSRMIRPPKRELKLVPKVRK